jgi:hypothetical protein
LTTVLTGHWDIPYVWQCAPSTELKGYSKHFNGGCYQWQVRTSKIKITQTERIQGKCKSCGRRPRLWPHLVEAFFDEEEAQQVADHRNKTLQGYPPIDEVEDYELQFYELHPNETEVIE